MTISLRRGSKILLLVLSVAACSSMKPLIVLASNTVEKIEIKNNDNYNFDNKRYQNSVVINDPGKIAEIIEFLKILNTGMERATTTYPTPKYTVLINDAENRNLVVFIGSNWIGGRNNIGGEASLNRLKTLEKHKITKLFELLGIDKKHNQ
jgi:hypothetical protein